MRKHEANHLNHYPHKNLINKATKAKPGFERLKSAFGSVLSLDNISVPCVCFGSTVGDVVLGLVLAWLQFVPPKQ